MKMKVCLMNVKCGDVWASKFNTTLSPEEATTLDLTVADKKPQNKSRD